MVVKLLSHLNEHNTKLYMKEIETEEKIPLTINIMDRLEKYITRAFDATNYLVHYVWGDYKHRSFDIAIAYKYDNDLDWQNIEVTIPREVDWSSRQDIDDVVIEIVDLAIDKYNMKEGL